MTELELKLEELAKREAEDKKLITDKVQLSRVQRKLDRLGNERTREARVAVAIVAGTTNVLKDIEAQCEEVVRSMAIFNNRTRSNRTWNPSRQYGMGNHITLLTGILTGIYYSTEAHKAQMLALTGLSEDLVEQTLEAFGTPAYYSSTYNIVVEEEPCDVDRLLDRLHLIEEALDITLDLSKVNKTIMHRRFEIAKSRANTDKAEAEKAIATSVHGLIID